MVEADFRACELSHIYFNARSENFTIYVVHFNPFVVNFRQFNTFCELDNVEVLFRLGGPLRIAPLTAGYPGLCTSICIE